MRSLLRIVAPVVATVAIALGGASSTLAAPPSSGPASGFVVDDAWCNGDASFMTCFEISGHVQFVVTGAKSAVVINQHEHADHYIDGALVAVTDEFVHERFAVNGNDTYTTQVVTHTRVAEGDVTCQYQLVYRIVDFDLVTDHQGGTCG